MAVCFTFDQSGEMNYTMHGRRFVGQSGSHLIGVLEGPAVDTVEGGVQPTLGEPDNVASLETTSTDGVEWSVPVKSFACDLSNQASLVY